MMMIMIIIMLLPPVTVSGNRLDKAEAKGFFLYPLSPDQLWGPPSLLYNGSFPCG
jgi:hypothetical protein